MRTLALSLLLGLCLLIHRANAAVPVEEVGPNLIVNEITAVQSVLIVANQVLDLTTIATFALETGAWVEELRRMREIIEDADALVLDLTRIQAQMDFLFGLRTAPDTAVAFEMRAMEIRMAVVEAYGYARRVQNLISTALSAVSHLLDLFNHARELIGNLQGQQVLAQSQLKLAQILTEQKAITAAFQDAEAVKELSTPVMVEGLKRINRRIMADHPQ